MTPHSVHAAAVSFGLAFALAILAASPSARAGAPDGGKKKSKDLGRSFLPDLDKAASRLTPLQPFEEELLVRALESRGLKPDPDPEGKVISRIEISTEKILAESDIYPKIFNILHTVTRDKIVRRELFFAPGDRFARSVIAETERELRKLIIFAAVRIVAFKVPEAGAVGVLVVTKDLWSLRTNFDVRFNIILEYFEMNPSENNLAGRYKMLTGHIQADLGKFAFGEGFFEPRLFGSRLQAFEDVRVEFTRGSGKPEGVIAGAFVRRPLFSLESEYSWALVASVDHGIDRVFRGRGLFTYDAAVTPFDDRIPYAYRRTKITAAARVVRSFGYDVKHNVRLTAGYLADQSRVRDDLLDPPPGLHPWLCPARVDACGWESARDEFRSEVLPADESFLFARVRYTTTRERYAKLKNFGAFGVTEDFQLGHMLQLQATFGASLDKSPDFVEVGLDLRYRFELGDDLLSISAGARTRILSRAGEEIVGDLIHPRLVNNYVYVTVRNATPLLLFGRIHARLTFSARESDLDKARYCVGGGYPTDPVIGHGDLRGFFTNRFCGTTRLLFNVELRTLPLNLWTFQLGAVLFWDNAMLWGDEAPDYDTFARYLDGGGSRALLKSAVGIGLRGQFPQLDREAFRLDIGFPISGREEDFARGPNRPEGDPPFAIVFIFRQVF